MTAMDVGTEQTQTTRVPFWDNARFACVTLVVIGHGIQRLTLDFDPALSVYLFIYAFHMPAFAIISGYFSKADSPNRQQMMKVITDLLLPYLIMEFIWSVVKYLVEGTVDFNPTTASWTLWFLLALAIFRLILPYLVLLRWPLLWAVLAPVVVGFYANVDGTFSLARALGILPFFVLGWKLREYDLAQRWLNAGPVVWWVRAAAVIVLGAWLAATLALVTPMREFRLARWFFYDQGYDDLGQAEWWAPFARLAFVVLAVVLSAALFALIPRSTTWVTELGRATMYVYLLHSFVLYPLRESGVLQGEHSSLAWLVGMILASVAISLALSSPLVRRVFRPLVEPKPRWLFTTS